jgi:LEA14-like dessication related protein
MKKRLSTLGLVMLAIAGCSLAKLQTPQLQVVGVEVLRSDLLQQQLRVRMRVDNPNDRKQWAPPNSM